MILHIATQGYYLQSPEPAPDRTSKEELLKKEKYGYLRSGLILQPGVADATTDEDRVMTSLEIALLNLKNTELVVLSACDSGVGDTTPGDSVSGLRSAFQIAGARAVVSSPWTINDEKGEAYMETFYRTLVEAGKQRTQTINQSLRQAKLTLVNQQQHPYYWAAFVMDGKDQPLPISSQH
jgi:CHAT domain-containing protein